MMITHEIKFGQMIQLFEPFVIRFYLALSPLSLVGPVVYYRNEIINRLRNATSSTQCCDVRFLLQVRVIEVIDKT
jgi:hypothetical protein